jgi:hypothetical protein
VYFGTRFNRARFASLGALAASDLTATSTTTSSSAVIA